MVVGGLCAHDGLCVDPHTGAVEGVGDQGALAGDVTAPQCGDHAAEDEQTGDHVAIAAGGTDGEGTFLHPTHTGADPRPEGGDVEAGGFGVGAAVTVAGEVEVDELGELFFQGVVVQPHLGQTLHAHAGAEHIGVLQQLHKHCSAAFGFQIQADQALAVVLDGEDGAGEIING